MSTLIFVALVTGDHDAGYAATFPDLPDAAAAGPGMAELLAAAREAVQKALRKLTDTGGEWPAPTPLEQVALTPGAVAVLVDVAVEDTPVRVNISIGERLLQRIDQAAEARGMSRSGYIAAAARSALGERPFRTGAADVDAVARKVQDEWAALSRKITEGLGADSAFSRNLADLDNRVTETIRKAADSVSAAMARRHEAEAAPRPAGPDGPPADHVTDTVGHA